MRITKSVFIIILTIFIITNTTSAQSDSKTASHELSVNIKKFALIGIESNKAHNAIVFEPAEPTQPGMGYNLTGLSNNDLWLNYSSISSENQNRAITVKLEGTLPQGLAVQLEVKNPTEHGKGRLGTGAKNLTLNGSEQHAVTGIGSCYTGTGYQKGCNLNYSLQMNDEKYEHLLANSYSITITYTITE